MFPSTESDWSLDCESRKLVCKLHSVSEVLRDHDLTQFERCYRDTGLFPKRHCPSGGNNAGDTGTESMKCTINMLQNYINELKVVSLELQSWCYISAKRWNYISPVYHVMPSGLKRLFPIHLNGERDVCNQWIHSFWASQPLRNDPFRYIGPNLMLKCLVCNHCPAVYPKPLCQGAGIHVPLVLCFL